MSPGRLCRVILRELVPYPGLPKCNGRFDSPPAQAGQAFSPWGRRGRFIVLQTYLLCTKVFAVRIYTPL